MKTLIFSIVLLAAATPLFAQDHWVLTTADFGRRQVMLRAISMDKGIVAEDRAVAMDRFLLLERVKAASTQRGAFTLWLLNGDRITGEPTGVKGESLVWNSSAIGEVVYPLRDIAGFAREAGAVSLDSNRANDLAGLKNGDIVTGIFSTIKDGKLIMRADGADVPLAMDAVMSLSLAVTGASKPSSDRAFRVRTSDGSSIVAGLLRTDGDKLILTLTDKTERPLPLSAVVSIEQLNGPVAWLSTLAAATSEQTPYMGQSWPARMDTNVAGKPIKVGDREISRGIGVHARSKLVYDLDGSYAAFRTQYAIDGNGPYADVDVRIWLDGKVVHERKGFKAGPSAPVLTIPLGAARQLTLEVDYGRTHDVQDRFNWIEPALLRKLSAEGPSSQPSTLP